MEKLYTFQHVLGSKPLTLELGKLAGQADAAITVRYGDTLLLVTVCISPEPRKGIDFVPLTIDYEERLYAAGKIPGSFFRREGRPGQEAVLAGRLTDRPIRPLLPKGFRHEVQIIATVLSADQENQPDVLATVGASTALTISDIPFAGPAGAVRVGYLGQDFVINPTYAQVEAGILDLVVVSTKQGVMMVEAGAKEAPEEIVLQAIRFGHEVNQGLIRLQEEIGSKLGKPKMKFQAWEPAPQAVQAVGDALGGRLREVWRGGGAGVEALRTEVLEKLGEAFPQEDLAAAFEGEVKKALRQFILRERRRPSGRSLDQLRHLAAEVGILPRSHGSGLFTRGETQVLTSATLGSAREEQELDTISPEEKKRFIHHYNFPPYSTGEVRRLGATGRREIGHGALAERALEPMLPSPQEFPYTIRLVSEVLSSNGSTSMASVCGSTLALQDAGVPIKAPVAGVAMGLISGDGEYALLTDIEGVEDAYGDMDFKVAGTEKGITALQLDIKLQGVSQEVLAGALERAKAARHQILQKLQEAIPQSRPVLSPYAPRMYRVTVEPEKIGAVIGSGGRRIRAIQEETKTTIDIRDDGSITIGSPSEEAAQRAIKIIEDLTRDIEVGTIFTGKVTRLLSLGAMVEILPGKEGMVSLTELGDPQARHPGDVVKIGDEIMVKVVEIDRLGRVNLSRRAVLQTAPQEGQPPRGDTGGQAPPPRRPWSPRPPSTGRRPEGRPPRGR